MPTAIDPATLAEIQRYTKLFWINTGPYNNLTARKFVLQVHARGVCRRGARGRAEPARVPAARRRDRSTRLLARLQPLFFDPDVDPIVTNKTPRRRQGHPRREREQPLRRRHDEGPRRVRGALSAQLAAGEAATASSSKRSTASAAATTRRSARSSGTSRRRSRTRPSRWPTALRALIKFYQTGETADREAYDIAWVAGQGLAGRHDQRLHRGLPGRARHQGRVGSARLLRQPREDRRDPEARRRRAVVRGPHAVGRRSTASRASAASPPTPSTSSIETGDSGPITPVGINLPNDQDDPRAATAASRCRSRTSTRPTTSRRCRSSAREFAWTPEEAARAEKWSALAGELTTEHARGDRPRARARSPSG